MLFLLSLFFLMAFTESWILYMKSSKDNLRFRIICFSLRRIYSTFWQTATRGALTHPLWTDEEASYPLPVTFPLLPKGSQSPTVLMPICVWFRPCKKWSFQVHPYSEDGGQAGSQQKAWGFARAPTALLPWTYIFSLQPHEVAGSSACWQTQAWRGKRCLLSGSPVAHLSVQLQPLGSLWPRYFSKANKWIF